MGIEDFPKPTKPEGDSMNKEQLSPVDKIIGAIRIRAEILLKNRGEIWEATPKVVRWLPQIRQQMREMEQATAKPHVKEIEKLLEGTDEPTPHNEEEVQQLLNKLGMPAFREKIEQKLHNAQA